MINLISKGNILLSNVVARIISATINYNINKKHVFKSKEKGIIPIFKYTILAIGILTLNSIILMLLTKNVVTNIFPIFFRNKEEIGIVSLCVYRIENKYAKEQLDKYIVVNEEKHKVNMLLKNGIKFLKFGKFSYFFNIYIAKFNMNFLKTCPIQNSIKAIFENKDNIKIEAPVAYNAIYLNKNKGHTSKIYKIKDSGLVCYFRQGKSNSMCITVRKKNITDSYLKKISIFFAWILSKLLGKSNSILLYEKECNKYEESASMLYEKLIDNGYKNVYFIINKTSSHVQFIQERYRKNVIWAHTFKHYLNFFRCKKFIGTEAVTHVLELRAANTFVTKKLQAKKFKFVFLQHGVMYMVSLDAKIRSFFRKGIEMPLDAKIVVSSQAEADHFIELGGFEQDDLYITGLPFYDRTIKKENANKITIMPTWRPWDYNTLVSDYTNSNYYNMVLNIYNNIPEELKERVVILPHPLIIDIFKNTPLGKYIPEIITYDKILEDTALLITDYSSIAYSAFYRGANVIFVWNEKEECMNKYEGHLMLNEDNVFGDYIYDYSKLEEVIKNNYLKGQNEEYKEKYSRIVEFHDNNNTQRLINLLEQDGFLK